MGLSPLQQLLRVLPAGTKLMEKLQEKGGVDFERGKKQAMVGLNGCGVAHNLMFWHCGCSKGDMAGAHKQHMNAWHAARVAH